MNDAYLIVNDAPKATQVRAHKYDANFAAMQPGQAIKCCPKEVDQVASAMKRYIGRTGVKAHVKTAKDYGDGMARVWLMGGAK